MPQSTKIDTDVHEIAKAIIESYPPASRPTKQALFNGELRAALRRRARKLGLKIEAGAGAPDR